MWAWMKNIGILFTLNTHNSAISFRQKPTIDIMEKAKNAPPL